MKLADLCEASSFAEPDAAFPPSPDFPLAKPVFPELPLDFTEPLSFASDDFPSVSVAVISVPWAYTRDGYRR